eukprot:gb/GECG01012046.1/.p1 GENE.gb/GECG01012046.1/~~gb/GECG01012046.1/.p1  ORF type:complete len:303 (+),score=30.78 gb/GECG01012046.1/:1-909(+)
MSGAEQTTINVVLFKEPDQEYIDALRQYLPNRRVMCTETQSDESSREDDVYVSFCPLLGFEFCGTDSIVSALESIERKETKYDAVILTSPRAVEALSQALGRFSAQELDVVVSALSGDTTLYCVGKKTSQKLEELGFSNIRGKGCGNADQLKQFIEDDFAERLNETEQQPTCLFLCGEKHRPAIPSLENDGILLKQIIVYRSHSRSSEKITSDLRRHKIIREGSSGEWTERRTILCIFSPSGVQTLSTAGILTSHTGHKPQIVAIGPSTEQELETEAVPCSRVSKEPSPEGIGESVAALLSW